MSLCRLPCHVNTVMIYNRFNLWVGYKSKRIQHITLKPPLSKWDKTSLHRRSVHTLVRCFDSRITAYVFTLVRWLLYTVPSCQAQHIVSSWLSWTSTLKQSSSFSGKCCGKCFVHVQYAFSSLPISALLSPHTYHAWQSKLPCDPCSFLLSLRLEPHKISKKVSSHRVEMVTAFQHSLLSKKLDSW